MRVHLAVYHIRISCNHVLASNGLSFSTSFKASGCLVKSKTHGRLTWMTPSPKLSNTVANCCVLICNCIKVKSIAVLFFPLVLSPFTIQGCAVYSFVPCILDWLSAHSKKQVCILHDSIIAGGVRLRCTRKMCWSRASNFSRLARSTLDTRATFNAPFAYSNFSSLNQNHNMYRN